MTPPEPRGREGLKPRPWCGAPGYFVQAAERVKCTGTDCNAQGGRFEVRSQAIAAWNRRPTAPSASGGESLSSKTVGDNASGDPDVNVAGGEAVAKMRVHLVRGKVYGDLAIRHWVNEGLTEGEHVLFAHPARMPTQALAKALFDEAWRGVPGKAWDEASDHYQADFMARAARIAEALFHTGETKEDGRG